MAGIASLIGTVVSAAGTIAAGRAGRRAAEFEAARDEARGKEEQARAQREQFAEERRKRLALSELQARHAASGFSPADPTAAAIDAETAGYGTYRANLAGYEGRSNRIRLEESAYATRERGRTAERQSRFRAAATLIGGAGSFFRNYGGYR